MSDFPIGGVGSRLERAGFAFHRPGNGGLAQAAGLAVLLGAVVILADLKLVHPKDINVPWPASVVFYPLIGVVAEMVFHVLPLAALLTVLPVRASMLTTALIEPSFQIALMLAGTPIVGITREYSVTLLMFAGFRSLSSITRSCRFSGVMISSQCISSGWSIT